MGEYDIKPIVVIGSINMDLVCRTRHMPRPGETVMGSDAAAIPGGKGANQAVAAAKLGGDVYMIGRVGDDDFGDRLRNGLRQHQVHTEHVTITEGTASGLAMILVDRKGENSIVVAPGANARLEPKDIDAAEKLIARAAVVVMQLEVPLETVRHAITLCRRLGIRTILDPAPVPERGLPRDMYAVDILTPNQTEAQALLSAGKRPKAGSASQRDAAMGRIKRTRVADAKQIASDLLARGARRVLLKLGAKGSMLVNGSHELIEHARGFKVEVVDTTAAGDAFIGALAVALTEDQPIERAMRFANAAGAFCCTGFGAQPSLPTRAQVEHLLASPAGRAER